MAVQAYNLLMVLILFCFMTEFVVTNFDNIIQVVCFV